MCFSIKYEGQSVIVSCTIVNVWQKVVEPSVEVLEICRIKLFPNTSQMNLSLFFVYSIYSTQVRFPPTEHKGQLSQTLRLISPTFPGRENHSTLVNHYHTQLIILRALYENFHDASLLLLLLPSSSFLFFLVPLVLLLHIPRRHPLACIGDRACLSCGFPVRARKTWVSQAAPQKCHLPPPLQADDKVSISALHPPP